MKLQTFFWLSLLSLPIQGSQEGFSWDFLSYPRISFYVFFSCHIDIFFVHGILYSDSSPSLILISVGCSFILWNLISGYSFVFFGFRITLCYSPAIFCDLELEFRMGMGRKADIFFQLIFQCHVSVFPFWIPVFNSF